VEHLHYVKLALIVKIKCRRGHPRENVPQAVLDIRCLQALAINRNGLGRCVYREHSRGSFGENSGPQAGAACKLYDVAERDSRSQYVLDGAYFSEPCGTMLGAAVVPTFT